MAKYNNLNALQRLLLVVTLLVATAYIVFEERFEHNVYAVAIKDVNGNLILVNPRDNTVSELITRYKVWEPHVNKLLDKVVHKGDKVLSLGGHIGFHILHFSKLVGSNSKVYTFEPNPLAHEFLMYNLSLNQIHNVEVYRQAAYSKNKILKFAAYNDNGSNNGGSYVTDGREIPRDAHEISVQGVKVDDVLSHVSKVDILQMDIEGCEPNAVYGAKKLIERSKDLLVLQEWSVDLMKPNADVKKYIKFWRDKGYKFARITWKGLFELTDEQLLVEPHIIDIVISKDLQKLQSLY